MCCGYTLSYCDLFEATLNQANNVKNSPTSIPTDLVRLKQAYAKKKNLESYYLPFRWHRTEAWRLVTHHRIARYYGGMCVHYWEAYDKGVN